MEKKIANEIKKLVLAALADFAECKANENNCWEQSQALFEIEGKDSEAANKWFEQGREWNDKMEEARTRVKGFRHALAGMLDAMGISYDSWTPETAEF